MARKILTASLNKEGKGTIGMIVPDFNPSSHRMKMYEVLKKSIDEGKPIMYNDLSEGEEKK